MTAFTIGARCNILAPSYPNATGVVTDPANGNVVLTVTVLVDAGEHLPAHETYFDPTDELELINDDTASVRPESLPHTGERQGISRSEVAVGVAAE